METVRGFFSGLVTGVSWELAAITGLIACCVTFLVAGLWSFAIDQDVVGSRLQRLTGRVDLLGMRRVASGTRAWIGRIAQPVAWLARPSKAAELQQLRLKLTQAGYTGEFATEIFLAAKILLAAGFTVGMLEILSLARRDVQVPMQAAVAVAACAMGFLLPNLILASKLKERQDTLERALPDAMDLLVTCVEAGLGLDASLSRVSEEMLLAAPRLGRELNVTFLEIQAGVQRRDAFRRLAERTGVEELKTLAAMLTQSEMFGTSVAKALRVHAEGMRVRRMQKAEEKAAMVSVKMTFPLVLCILPSLVAVIMGPAAAMIAKTFFPQWDR